MALINIKNLTFGYDNGSENIFNNVSIMVDTDWKLGFIGRNGRGKTTLLNLLLGRLEYKGSIVSPVAFDYFPVEVSDKERPSAEVFSELCFDCAEWERDRELNLLGLDEKILLQPYKTLSGGEQTKLLLAALFLKGNNFLLIDEPTNHLDAEGRELVARYLKRKKGFILVSHDRRFLDGCVNHILSINKANIEIQRGNYSSWKENRDRQDGFERAENEKLKGEIKRLSDAAKRKSDWSDGAERSKYGGDGTEWKDRGYIGHKAAKTMKAAKVLEKRQENALAEKSALLKNLEASEVLSFSPLEYPKELLIEARALCLYYGERKIFDNLNFSLRRGEIKAVSGRNGCGKSSLLKLICGEKIAFSGSLSIGSSMKISYVSQDTDMLKGSLRDYAREYEIDESLFKTLLIKFDLRREHLDKPMEELSCGQKKKVLLARSLSEKAHLYIWDEPLNFIDILSRIQIEETLKRCRPTMLFIEHDKEFSESTANSPPILM